MILELTTLALALASDAAHGTGDDPVPPKRWQHWTPKQKIRHANGLREVFGLPVLDSEQVLSILLEESDRTPSRYLLHAGSPTYEAIEIYEVTRVDPNCRPGPRMYEKPLWKIELYKAWDPDLPWDEIFEVTRRDRGYSSAIACLSQQMFLPYTTGLEERPLFCDEDEVRGFCGGVP